jgi:hypothetical protein
MYWNKDYEQNLNEESQVDAFDESYEDDGEPLNIETLVEAFIVDTVARMNDEERKAFMESDCFAQLCECNLLEAKSITRLNKEDDFTRRVRVAAISKAHAAGDMLESELRKVRIREKSLLDKIYKKYSNSVKREVQNAQRRLVRINPQIFNTLRAIR